MNQFKVISKFNPTGDQPKAIKSIAKGIEKKRKISNFNRRDRIR